MAQTMDIDQINRRTWKTGQVFHQYRNLEGYVDPGERAATQWLAQECSGKPVLDMGVGCGRTTPLLRAISPDYVGLDYTQELLTVAQRKYPEVAFRHMDARDLSAFADDSFYLVNFSFNAIDAVDIKDRIQILREVYRVLQPNGLFLLSSHNAAGPGARESLLNLMPHFTRNPFKLGWRLAKWTVSLPLALYNYSRFHGMHEQHGGYVVSNASAHNFGLVVLYVTLAEQQRQLREAGFLTERIFDSARGLPVTESDDLRDVWWLHYAARKPAA